jgi:ABC-type multidrug transport system fused ATPase/permease subunit
MERERRARKLARAHIRAVFRQRPGILAGIAAVTTLGAGLATLDPFIVRLFVSNIGAGAITEATVTFTVGLVAGRAIWSGTGAAVSALSERLSDDLRQRLLRPILHRVVRSGRTNGLELDNPKDDLDKAEQNIKERVAMFSTLAQFAGTTIGLTVLSPTFGGIYLGVSAVLAVVTQKARRVLEKPEKQLIDLTTKGDNIFQSLRVGRHTIAGTSGEDTVVDELLEIGTARSRLAAKLRVRTHFLDDAFWLTTNALVFPAVLFLGATTSMFNTSLLWTVSVMGANALGFATRAASGALVESSTGAALQRVSERIDRVAQLDRRRTLDVPADSAGLPILDINELVFRYPGATRDALDTSGFRLSIERGDHVFVRGPSGSGKSTLFELLWGLVEPTSGSVKIKGVEISQVSLEKLNGVVQVVEQSPKFFPGTIRHNIALPNGRIPNALIKELFALSGLGDTSGITLDTLIGNTASGEAHGLSGGQLKMVAFLRAIAAERPPDLLILDEVTSGWDPKLLAAAKRLLKYTKIETVIEISHLQQTVVSPNKELSLRRGKIVKDSQQPASEAALHSPDGLTKLKPSTPAARIEGGKDVVEALLLAHHKGPQLLPHGSLTSARETFLRRCALGQLVTSAPTLRSAVCSAVELDDAQLNALMRDDSFRYRLGSLIDTVVQTGRGWSEDALATELASEASRAFRPLDLLRTIRQAGEAFMEELTREHVDPAFTFDGMSYWERQVAVMGTMATVPPLRAAIVDGLGIDDTTFRDHRDLGLWYIRAFLYDQAMCSGHATSVEQLTKQLRRDAEQLAGCAAELTSRSPTATIEP